MGTNRPILIYHWCTSGHYVEVQEAIRRHEDSQPCCPIHLKPLAAKEQKFISTAILKARTPKMQPLRPGYATVGVASALALADNYERTGLVLINTSVNVISIAFGHPAVLNSGITLNAAGGTFVMGEFIFSTAAVYAIAAAAASNLAVQEYT
jgi:hypothetical protein